MEKLLIKETENAQLSWAFSIISEFMLNKDLAVMQSQRYKLVVTWLGDCELVKE